MNIEQTTTVDLGVVEEKAPKIPRKYGEQILKTELKDNPKVGKTKNTTTKLYPSLRDKVLGTDLLGSLGIKTEESNQFQKHILVGLNYKLKQGEWFYRETVNENKLSKRRAKNKVAKASRRKNRS